VEFAGDLSVVQELIDLLAGFGDGVDDDVAIVALRSRLVPAGCAALLMWRARPAMKRAVAPGGDRA
jgi:hypothetical protein